MTTEEVEEEDVKKKMKSSEVWRDSEDDTASSFPLKYGLLPTQRTRKNSREELVLLNRAWQRHSRNWEPFAGSSSLNASSSFHLLLEEGVFCGNNTLGEITDFLSQQSLCLSFLLCRCYCESSNLRSASNRVDMILQETSFTQRRNLLFKQGIPEGIFKKECLLFPIFQSI